MRAERLSCRVRSISSAYSPCLNSEQVTIDGLPAGHTRQKLKVGFKRITPAALISKQLGKLYPGRWPRVSRQMSCSSS